MTSQLIVQTLKYVTLWTRREMQGGLTISEPKISELWSGRCKSKKGEERARIKACSWATRSVENSGQKHRKTGKAGAGPLGQSQAQWGEGLLTLHVTKENTVSLSMELKSVFPSRSESTHIRTAPSFVCGLKTKTTTVMEKWQTVRKRGICEETECLSGKRWENWK